MLLAGFQNCYGSVTAIRLSFLPSLKENFSEIILSLYHIICCTCVGMGQTMGPFISQVFRLRGITLRELLRDLHLHWNLIYVIKSWSSSLSGCHNGMRMLGLRRRCMPFPCGKNVNNNVIREQTVTA